jgi:hypothetical protein
VHLYLGFGGGGGGFKKKARKFLIKLMFLKIFKFLLLKKWSVQLIRGRGVFEKIRQSKFPSLRPPKLQTCYSKFPHTLKSGEHDGYMNFLTTP